VAYLNLSALRSDVREQLHDSNLSTTHIDRWTNLAQSEVVRAMDPDYYLEELSLTLTATQAVYGVAMSMHKMVGVTDVTNNHPVQATTMEQLDLHDPDRSDTGAVWQYALMGIFGVQTQPSSASTLSIVSSSASDTSVVRVRGVTSNNVIETEAVTLTGTTPVATTLSYTTVYDFSKTAATVGRLTATSNSGAITNVVMPAEDLSMEFQHLRVWRTPDAADVLRLRYLRRPRALVNPQDAPDVPQRWHELILHGTLVHGFRDKAEDQVADRYQHLRREQGHLRDVRRKRRLPRKLGITRIPGWDNSQDAS
jgi:hypothetical protein